jgi:ribonucleoside-triphosphate reductase
MDMIVSKRDGRKVLFNREKIKDAILNAFLEVDGEESQYAKDKARDISGYIESLNKDLSV